MIISGLSHPYGSPFTITVKMPVKKLGTPIKIISGLNETRGVAVNQRGEILVAEHKRNCISIFSQTGEKLRSFGSQGPEPGQFRYPHGVTLDDNDNILVTDNIMGNNHIQIFSSDHTLIRSVGSRGNNLLQFENLLTIAISPATKNIHYSHTREIS